MEKKDADTFRHSRDLLHFIGADYFPHRSPGLLFKTVRWIASKKLAALVQWRHDARHTTYSKTEAVPAGELFSYIPLPATDLLRAHSRQIEGLTANYLAHRFDLLGSGWVEVKHGMQCRGLEGYLYEMGSAVAGDNGGAWLKERINSANLGRSRRIYRFVSENYTPIDWHLDFKSGYRWSERTWYREVKYGHRLGADIKVPWELARMQHLPQLAWAYGLAKEETAGFLAPSRYLHEFRNQILDFVATNPPRFGVNWHMTMDVAIRATNWLVAYDLFRGYGAEFDEGFKTIFHQSIYEHGLHVVRNLEWRPDRRDNHYLANIAGLLFTAAYLPSTAEIDGWLAFCVQELIREVGSQFYPDGSNFEGSTSYHRLAAETVIYATALVLALPMEKKRALKDYDPLTTGIEPDLHPPPLPHYMIATAKPPRSEVGNSHYETSFPAWYFERLERMAEFTMHITKPDGRIPQIGDTDNGRLLKLQPVHRQITVAMARKLYSNLDAYHGLPDEAVYWDEEHLSHQHLVAAINGLFGREDLVDLTGKRWLEFDLVRGMAGGVRFNSYLAKKSKAAAEMVTEGSDKNWARLEERFGAYSADQQEVTTIEIPGQNIRVGIKLYAYPDFGLYLYRSGRMFLAIRCGAIGQKGKGGHAHNDQLSLELNIDGEDWILDPGTYLYTPLPEKRNEYRSVKAHFAPRLKSGQEPGRLDLGIFRLGNEAMARCLYFGQEGFIGVHRGYGKPVYRLVKIEQNRVTVIDAGGRFTSLGGPGWFQAQGDRRVAHCHPSPGYGYRWRCHG
jgi:hypothetical protein